MLNCHWVAKTRLIIMCFLTERHQTLRPLIVRRGLCHDLFAHRSRKSFINPGEKGRGGSSNSNFQVLWFNWHNFIFHFEIDFHKLLPELFLRTNHLNLAEIMLDGRIINRDQLKVYRLLELNFIFV